MTGDEKSAFPVKELLVFVPAAGSAMALSWEVGSFLPIGGGSFMLFTLTEHLMFAVQALPATLVVASMLVLPFALTGSLDRIADVALKKIEGPAVPSDADPVAAVAVLRVKISRLRRGMTALRLAAVALGLLVSFWGFHVRSAAIIVFGSGIAGAAILWDASPISKQVPLLSWLLIFSFGVAMAFGADYSRLVLNNDRNIVDVKVRQETKKAVLVRSGERGVLLFEPLTGKFSVEKWDAIQGLNWERTPLFKMLFKEQG
ncbi:MAG: hypothetical protein QOJ86_521 [Bradyrhizobium sp.]|jgi:hypothetical protein|nr:hypothetical protein [Bradyrhizobium sp.]